MILSNLRNEFSKMKIEDIIIRIFFFPIFLGLWLLDKVYESDIQIFEEEKPYPKYKYDYNYNAHYKKGFIWDKETEKFYKEKIPPYPSV